MIKPIVLKREEKESAEGRERALPLLPPKEPRKSVDSREEDSNEKERNGKVPAGLNRPITMILVQKVRRDFGELIEREESFLIVFKRDKAREDGQSVMEIIRGMKETMVETQVEDVVDGGDTHSNSTPRISKEIVSCCADSKENVHITHH